MESLNLLQSVKKNKANTVFVIGVVAVVLYFLIDQIQDVRHAATPYDYCVSVCDLFEFTGKIICWTITPLWHILLIFRSCIANGVSGCFILWPLSF